MIDNKIYNVENNELVKIYEEYKKKKKGKLIIFKLTLLAFNYNNIFSNNNISINIYRKHSS